jgi:hypothetical protein
MHAGDGAKAHRESDQRVLDEILSGVFLPESSEQWVEQFLRRGSIHSYSQRDPRGLSDTQSSQTTWMGRGRHSPEGGSGLRRAKFAGREEDRHYCKGGMRAP